MTATWLLRLLLLLLLLQLHAVKALQHTSYAAEAFHTLKVEHALHMLLYSRLCLLEQFVQLAVGILQEFRGWAIFFAAATFTKNQDACKKMEHWQYLMCHCDDCGMLKVLTECAVETNALMLINRS